MSYRYSRAFDRFVGNDYPGVCGNGMHNFIIDEIELGARVALALDEEDQWWWEIHREEIFAELSR